MKYSSTVSSSRRKARKVRVGPPSKCGEKESLMG